MEVRPRPRKRSANDHFVVEDFYFLPSEVCQECPPGNRPNQEHFHCLVCHHNLSSKSKKSTLKLHYQTRFKNRPHHDLTVPQRLVNCFACLGPEDQTLVREGNNFVIFSISH